MRYLSKHSERGDTLVEVLMSIAIVGMALGAAYSLANRSLQQGLSAREHTEALALAQGQIERLKAVNKQASDTFNNNYRTTQPFCITGAPTALAKTVGTACDAYDGSQYRVHITYEDDEPVPVGRGIFTISVTWDSIGDNPQESVEQRYRM